MNQTRTAYLAPDGFLNELLHELKNVEATHDRLVVCTGPRQDSVWAQNIWEDAQYLPIESISQAAKLLRSLAPLWVLYSVASHRRAQLIQEQLPKIKNQALKFLQEIPPVPLASWSLISDKQILISTKCLSALPNGEANFLEDKENPPSRAYLKLWETFTVHGVRPKRFEHCLDLGSCPGGWTWVLQTLGCQVTSVDKAPLDEKISRLPRIDFLKRNAFGLKPDEVHKPDWIFSDIICFPKKLYELVILWKKAYPQAKFVCTLKFQGQTDFEAIELFQNIPDSQVLHLYNNKHEVTWIHIPPSSAE